MTKARGPTVADLAAPVLPGGNCHGTPELLDLFFSDDADDQAAARGVCEGCPVRHDCYWGAIERREPWGIWGGSLFPGEWKDGRRRLIAQLFAADADGPALIGDDEPVSEVRSA